MKTRSIKKSEIINDWRIVDVTGVRLGTAATNIAKLLLGKNKVNAVDYHVSGDKVIVINTDKVDVFVKKLDSKSYHRHSGYMGGLTSTTLREQMQKDSTEVIKSAVWGMLPKTKQGRAILKNLRIYKGAEFEEVAQKPIETKINN